MSEIDFSLVMLGIFLFQSFLALAVFLLLAKKYKDCGYFEKGGNEVSGKSLLIYCLAVILIPILGPVLGFGLYLGSNPNSHYKESPAFIDTGDSSSNGGGE